MREYRALLNLVEGDTVLLDMHLNKLEVREEEYQEYLEVLILSTLETKPIRQGWRDYSKEAFDIGVIWQTPYKDLANLQKQRRHAYLKNNPAMISRYKELAQSNASLSS